MIREAVILAGGISKRLQGYTGGRPKWMIEIHGRPLISYPIMVLRSIGVKRFVVVVSEVWSQKMESILNALDIDFCIVRNDAVDRENGYSFLLSGKYVTSDSFFLSMSDHIYSTGLAKNLLIQRFKNIDILICGDKKPEYINIDEATKILTDNNGHVIKIGKNLRSYTYVDTGLFLIRKRLFKVAEMLSSEKFSFSFSDIINRAIKLNYVVKVAGITRGFWTEIDTVKDLMEALKGKRRRVVEFVLDELRIERRISEQELLLMRLRDYKEHII